MSNKIREHICELYEKDVLYQVKDRDLQRKLSDGLSNLLNKIELSERIELNVESPFDSCLDTPIDYEAIDKTARELGYLGGIKVRAYNAFQSNNINTYGDLITFRKNRLNRIVRREARERYSKDFEKLLANGHYRNFGAKVAKVLATHLKSISLINYFQD